MQMTQAELSQAAHRAGVHLWRFMRLVFRRFDQDRCNSVAQALSYTTLLALVPLTTVVFSLLSVFPVFQRWMLTIQTFIYSHFVATSGDVVQKYLQQFSSKSAQVTAVGLLFLILTALMLMHTVEQAFNDIWRAPKNRKLVYRFLTYWAILTLGPVLLGVSLSITSYLISLPLFSAQPVLAGFKHFLFAGLPFLFEILAFMLFYTVVPNVTVRWQHALIGSVLAAVLFEAAKRGFALFVLQFSSYKIIYGAIATLPVFLIWIYLSWIVILTGAIVVATLPQWGRLQADLTPQPP